MLYPKYYIHSLLEKMLEKFTWLGIKDKKIYCESCIIEGVGKKEVSEIREIDTKDGIYLSGWERISATDRLGFQKSLRKLQKMNFSDDIERLRLKYIYQEDNLYSIFSDKDERWVAISDLILNFVLCLFDCKLHECEIEMNYEYRIIRIRKNELIAYIVGLDANRSKMCSEIL